MLIYKLYTNSYSSYRYVYKICSNMAVFIQGPLLCQMGNKGWVGMKFMSFKEGTYVLRGAPSCDGHKPRCNQKPYFHITIRQYQPTIFTHPTQPSSHYIFVCVKRVKIYIFLGGGVFIAPWRKSLHFAMWSIYASLVWTRSSTIHHDLGERSTGETFKD